MLYIDSRWLLVSGLLTIYPGQGVRHIRGLAHIVTVKGHTNAFTKGKNAVFYKYKHIGKIIHGLHLKLTGLRSSNC